MHDWGWHWGEHGGGKAKWPHSGGPNGGGDLPKASMRDKRRGQPRAGHPDEIDNLGAAHLGCPITNCMFAASSVAASHSNCITNTIFVSFWDPWTGQEVQPN